MHYTSSYRGNSTVMIKDRKSRRWHACDVGTNHRHKCSHG